MTQQLERPGEVLVEKVQLLSTKGILVDLDDFFIEINLYEDIFSPSLTGTIILSDSRNLIKELPIIGEEILILKLTTPTFPTSIEGSFRVTRVSDKNVVSAQNAQLYTLHFTTQEMILDMNTAIYQMYKGRPDEIVSQIFTDYVQMDTTIDIFTAAENEFKYISPGWSAFRNLSWLASKAVPKYGKACNFLFWQSNKRFYWGSLETIFKNGKINGNYTYAPNNIRPESPQRDIQREMFITESVENVVTTDHAKDYINGYLANRVLKVDLYNKTFENIDYDHVNSFYNYVHMNGQGRSSLPFFAEGSLRNPTSNMIFYPHHEKMFNEGSDIIAGSDKFYPSIHGNRLSSLQELDNFKLNIIVPGRTDIECGNLIFLEYPLIEPKDKSNNTSDALDPLYTGIYLISAIHHKINKVDHKMVFELTKDSLSGSLQ